MDGNILRSDSRLRHSYETWRHFMLKPVTCPAEKRAPLHKTSHMSLLLTLVDRDYYPGLAALINSLIEYGFSGTIVVGATDVFPNWFLASLETIKDSPEEYSIG